MKETYRTLNMDYDPTPMDIQAWMDMTDTDKDGRVSLNEFEQAIIRSL